MDFDQSEESLFEEALKRYKAGSSAEELLTDFQKITSLININESSASEQSQTVDATQLSLFDGHFE